MKKFRLVLLYCANASIGSLFFGWSIGIYNAVQSNVEKVYEWSSTEKSFYNGLLTSLMPLGAMFGAYFSSFLAKRGRRQALLMTDAFGFAVSLLGLFAEFLIPLTMMRFCSGIVVGLNSALVPLYINEIAPPKLSGRLGTIVQMMINVGILSSFLLGLLLPSGENFNREDNLYKLLLTLPALFCLIRGLVLLKFFKYETPNYLLYVANSPEEARIVISAFDLNSIHENNFNIVEEKKGKSKENYSLFSAKYKRRTFTGLLLSIIQQFSGINAVIFYSNDIFTRSKNIDDKESLETSARRFTVLIGLLLIFASVLSGKLIDRFGRKSILFYGEAVLTVALASLSFSAALEVSNLSKIFMVGYIIAFGVSLGPVVWVYLPEILNEKGVALSCLSNWAACFIIGFCFPILVDYCGVAIVFQIFALSCLLGFLFIWLYVPETKSMTEEEIEEAFSKESMSVSDRIKLLRNKAGTTSDLPFALPVENPDSVEKANRSIKDK